MKINDYVRTKNYGIKKILDIGEFLGMKQYLIDEDGTYVIDNSIIKSSSNIIDLIEVGDYVDGFLIDYIDSERRYLRSERPYREHDTTYKALMEQGRDYNQCLHFFAEDIKSIVTKEQFESMKYEVE